MGWWLVGGKLGVGWLRLDSKLYVVNAIIIIFIFVLYCIVLVGW